MAKSKKKKKSTQQTPEQSHAVLQREENLNEDEILSAIPNLNELGDVLDGLSSVIHSMSSASEEYDRQVFRNPERSKLSKGFIHDLIVAIEELDPHKRAESIKSFFSKKLNKKEKEELFKQSKNYIEYMRVREEYQTVDRQCQLLLIQNILFGFFELKARDLKKNYKIDIEYSASIEAILQEAVLNNFLGNKKAIESFEPLNVREYIECVLNFTELRLSYAELRFNLGREVFEEKFNEKYMAEKFVDPIFSMKVTLNILKGFQQILNEIYRVRKSDSKDFFMNGHSKIRQAANKIIEWIDKKKIDSNTIRKKDLFEHNEENMEEIYALHCEIERQYAFANESDINNANSIPSKRKKKKKKKKKKISENGVSERPSRMEGKLLSEWIEVVGILNPFERHRRVNSFFEKHNVEIRITSNILEQLLSYSLNLTLTDDVYELHRRVLVLRDFIKFVSTDSFVSQEHIETFVQLFTALTGQLNQLSLNIKNENANVALFIEQVEGYLDVFCNILLMLHRYGKKESFSIGSDAKKEALFNNTISNIYDTLNYFGEHELCKQLLADCYTLSGELNYRFYAKGYDTNIISKNIVILDDEKNMDIENLKSFYKKLCFSFVYGDFNSILDENNSNELRQQSMSSEATFSVFKDINVSLSMLNSFVPLKIYEEEFKSLSVFVGNFKKEYQVNFKDNISKQLFINYLELIFMFFEQKHLTDMDDYKKQMIEEQALEDKLKAENVQREQEAHEKALIRDAKKEASIKKKEQKRIINEYLREEKKLVEEARRLEEKEIEKEKIRQLEEVKGNENRLENQIEVQIDRQKYSLSNEEIERSKNKVALLSIDSFKSKQDSLYLKGVVDLGFRVFDEIQDALFREGKLIENYNQLVENEFLSKVIFGMDDYKKFWGRNSQLKYFITSKLYGIESGQITLNYKRLEVLSLLMFPAVIRSRMHGGFRKITHQIARHFLNDFLGYPNGIDQSFFKSEFMRYIQVEFRKLLREFHAFSKGKGLYSRYPKLTVMLNVNQRLDDKLIASDSEMLDCQVDKLDSEDVNSIDADSVYLIQREDRCITLPKEVVGLLRFIESHQLRSYVVGGAVRDLLLQATPTDYDIVSDCTKEILDEFCGYPLQASPYVKNLYALHLGGHKIQIFLKEKGFSLKKDAEGRDFTINALYADANGAIYAPLEESETHLYSAMKLLHPIGDPIETFRSDPIRMLRAIRLSEKTGFDLSGNIKVAFLDARDSLLNIEIRSRIFAHLHEMIKNGNGYCVFEKLMFSGILGGIFPSYDFNFIPIWQNSTNEFKDYVKSLFVSYNGAIKNNNYLAELFTFPWRALNLNMPNVVPSEEISPFSVPNMKRGVYEYQEGASQPFITPMMRRNVPTSSDHSTDRSEVKLSGNQGVKNKP